MLNIAEPLHPRIPNPLRNLWNQHVNCNSKIQVVAIWPACWSSIASTRGFPWPFQGDGWKGLPLYPKDLEVQIHPQMPLEYDDPNPGIIGNIQVCHLLHRVWSVYIYIYTYIHTYTIIYACIIIDICIACPKNTAYYLGLRLIPGPSDDVQFHVLDLYPHQQEIHLEHWKTMKIVHGDGVKWPLWRKRWIANHRGVTWCGL